jgi:hypothetical protein
LIAQSVLPGEHHRTTGFCTAANASTHWCHARPTGSHATANDACSTGNASSRLTDLSQRPGIRLHQQAAKSSDGHVASKSKRHENLVKSVRGCNDRT